jgi:hypothetical protein
LLSTVGTVPGDLITDLEAAGLVADPYFENNWLNSSLWSGRLWSYSKTFTLILRAYTARPGELEAGPRRDSSCHKYNSQQ